MEEMIKYEKIDQPPHYQGLKGMAVIDIIEKYDLNFNKGNAIKYILRAGKKPDNSEEEELKKAIWYLEREIQKVQKAQKEHKEKVEGLEGLGRRR